jgi:putative SOS response-associated peptidase YedK
MPNELLMTGGFTQLSGWAEIAKSYRLEDDAASVHCRPRYNISPSQPCLIIRKERDSVRSVQMYARGLMRYFAVRKPVNRLTVALANSVM